MAEAAFDHAIFDTAAFVRGSDGTARSSTVKLVPDELLLFEEEVEEVDEEATVDADDEEDDADEEAPPDAGFSLVPAAGIGDAVLYGS